MALGREVADAYIAVNGDLEPFRRDLERARGSLTRFESALNGRFVGFNRDISLAELYLESFGRKLRGLAGLNVLEDTFRFGIRFFQNIDRHAVNLANMATLIGTVSAATVNLIGFIATMGADIAGLAGIGFLAPGFLTGFGIALGVTVAAFKDMKTVLADLGPSFSRLQDQISARFWEQAEGPIRNLTNSLLPTLERQLQRTATAMGGIFAELADSLRREATPDRVALMFERLNRAIDIGRDAVGPFTRALVNLGEVGSKSFERFAHWVVKLSQDFDNFITRSIASGDMDRWIENAIEGFKNVGRALSGAVGIVGALDSAFRAAGGGGLAEFAARLQAADEIMNSPRFQTALTNLFIGARAAMDGFFAGLGLLGPAFESLGAVFISVGGSIGESFKIIGGILAEVFMNPTLQNGFMGFMESVRAGLANLAPAAAPFATSLGSLLDLMGEVLESVTTVAAHLLTQWGPVLDTISGKFATLVGPLETTLLSVIDSLTPVLTSLGENVIGPLIELVKLLLPQVEALVGFLSPVLIPILEEFGQLIRDDINPGVAEFNKHLGEAPAQGKTFGDALREALTAVENFLNAVANPLPPGVGLFGDKTATEEFNRNVNQAFADFWTSVGTWIASLNSTVNAGLAAFWAGVGQWWAQGMATIAAQWNAFWSGLGTAITNFNASVNAALAEFWAFIGAQFTNFGASIAAAWNTFWTGLSAIVSVAWAGIMGVLQGAGAGILAFFAGFIAGAVSFWNGFWNSLSPTVQAAFATVGAVIGAAFAFISGVITGALVAIQGAWTTGWSAVSTFVSSVWNTITTAISSGIQRAQAVVAATLSAIAAGWNSTWSSISAFVSSIWNAIATAVSGGIQRAQQVVSSVLSAIVSTWNSQWSSIGNFVSSIWNTITAAISSGIQRAQSVISSVLSAIQGIWSSAWNNLMSTVSSIWNSIVAAAGAGINNILAAVGRLPGALGAMAGQMVSAGVQMMQGFVNGVVSMAGRVVQAGVDAVGGAINAVKSLLNLGSPSKLFKQFGVWTGQGLAIGMESMSGLIERAAVSMADSATHAFSRHSMFQQGQDAMRSLADGLTSKQPSLDRIINDMAPDFVTKFEALGSITPTVSTPAEPAAATRSVVFEEGAFQLVTPTRDPELVVHQVMDEFANNSNF